MDHSIQAILEPSEQVTWEGVVNRGVLVTFLVAALLILFVIAGFFFDQESVTVHSENSTRQMRGDLIAAGIVGIGGLFVLLWFFSDLVKRFVITNKRVIIKSGLIGTDFQSIYYEQIHQVLVNVGIIDKIFGVGSIQIDTGRMEILINNGDTDSRGRKMPSGATSRPAYDVLKHISTPYDVYRQIETVLSQRKESLYSGRADRESNPEAYQK